MRKFALLALLAAALAVPSIAAAATPQGHLTGSANLNGGALFPVDVTDGGTSYVGLENDRSGNCDGDSGTVTLGVTTESVLCAHFVASSRRLNTGSPKMRFAIQNTGTDFYAGLPHHGQRRVRRTPFAVGKLSDSARCWPRPG